MSFFLFLPQAHVPLDAPPLDFYANCSHLVEPRKTYCAMLAALDNSLEILVQQLKQKGLWEE